MNAGLKRLMFPREKLRTIAIDSPAGPGSIYQMSGLYPVIGNSCRVVPWCVMEGGFTYDPFDILGSMPDLETGRIDIGRRTRSLVAMLRDYGHNEVTHTDVAPECEEEWSPDYAIICEAYSPWGEATEGDYFDHGRCLQDFMEVVREHYACDPTVEVKFHNLQYGSNEIEVIRR